MAGERMEPGTTIRGTCDDCSREFDVAYEPKCKPVPTEPKAKPKKRGKPKGEDDDEEEGDTDTLDELKPNPLADGIEPAQVDYCPFCGSACVTWEFLD